ncbi:CPBP family intramembrane glutamic endopeptidase [Luteimonas notoginsengisoli]|uniref:CPBP family intramembrane glutamic endopeptidase n=1 Tax=Luteimonas notoginsengisoli TaxID=1578200 RepID=A0ABV7UTH0_9GAMM
MSASEISEKKVGLCRQWSLCALMVLAAFLLCAATGTSFSSLFLSRLSFAQEAIVALGLSALACLNAWLGYKLASKRPVAKHTIESYSRLDLRGWNPLLLAPAAGIGEEILFRGALQTLLGVWLSSALFVLAHTKAYRFNGLSRRVLLQAAGLFAVSLVLAAIAHFAGLVPAIIVHTVIDITGLYTVRHVIAQGLMPNNSSKPTPLRGAA